MTTLATVEELKPLVAAAAPGSGKLWGNYLLLGDENTVVEVGGHCRTLGPDNPVHQWRCLSQHLTPITAVWFEPPY
jgi:hypothetical protein